MTSLRVLEFMYKMKRLQSRTLRRASFSRCRLISGLLKTYHPDHEETKRVFDKIDKDRDGKISKEDLVAVLTAVRNEKMIDVAEQMVKAADQDGDECISFQEFMDVHEKWGHISDSEIRIAFHMWDLDRDGRIGVDDLEKMLRRLGETSSPEECRRMISAVDTDHDGLVDFQDFLSMMTRSMKPV